MANAATGGATTAAGDNDKKAPALGFNKMFVMLPVMLASRHLDADNETTLTYLRYAYGIMQVICVGIVLYCYSVSTRIKNATLVYVPPPPQPFFLNEQNAPKKYTQISYQDHITQVARQLVGSTVIGIALTCGLHYYRGMITGMAIQTVLAPFNLYESKLVRSILGGLALEPASAIFDEKCTLGPGEIVVDAAGNELAVQNAAASNSLEDILLDTWDAAASANIQVLLDAVTTSNVNSQTKQDRWTVLMILCGLKPTPVNAIRRCLEDFAADSTLTDKDGWNCLHWACFHGNVEAVKLVQSAELLVTKDASGKTPLDIAKSESNDAIVKILQEVKVDSKKDQ